MKKIWFIGLALFLFVSSGIIFSAAKDSSTAKKLFPVRVETQTGFNEFHIAEELGYYKEEGIQIEYVGLIKSGGVIPAVLTNNVDVFMDHPNSVVKAVLAGAKVKIVSPGMEDNPNFVHMNYIIRKEGEIQTTQDFLKRKVKVALSGLNSCTDLIFLDWLSQHNVPDSQAEFVLMPDDQQEQALEQGLIDLAILHPPFIKRAVNNPKLKSLFTSWDVNKNPGAGLSIRGFSLKFIKEHPEVVRAFNRANWKARKWINANQQKALEIEARRFNMKHEDVSVFWYDEDPDIKEIYIQTWIDAMVRHNQIKKGEIKTSDIYTNDYAPNAKK